MQTQLTDVARDVRYAVRGFRRNRGLAAVILVTLALGIGTSVAIFSAARILVTDALPFPEPDRLVSAELSERGGGGGNPTYGDFRTWESEVRRVVALSAYTFGNHAVGDGSRTANFFAGRVTAGFFSVLGVRPLLGRMFSAGDDSPGGAPVAIITQRLWEGWFGGDPDVLGSSVRIDGRPHTVIGVVPRGLQFPAGADLWVPLVPATDEATTLPVQVIGRLRQGATVEEVRVALETVQQGIDAGRPADERAVGVAVASLAGGPSGNDRIGLLLLQAAVVLLLLIASTNAAGLMLTRGMQRRQEIAVRASLGAGRARIVRQLLVESTLLALGAGVLGILVAYVALEALRNALPSLQTRHMLGWDRLALDGHAVLVALALSVLTGVAFGIGPAIRAVRGDLVVHLREGAPTTTAGRGSSRITRLLLGGEVALALTLLLTAGLLTRSLLELLRADPGFRAEDVLAVQWTLPPERYDSLEAITRFQDPLLARLYALPGVRSVGIVSNLPMSRSGWSREYRLLGAGPGAEDLRASWRPITPEYLESMGIPLLRGRHLARSDGPGAARVAIISESLVQRHWPDGADPLGRQLEVEGERWSVVGVAQDVHDFGVDQRAGPTIYVPQRQAPTTAGYIAVLAAGDPADLAPLVRREIWAIDPGTAVDEIRTMERMVRDFFATERLMAILMATFATISLLITVISLYTLVAHSVARRHREIGIRLALGARPRQILLGAVSHGITWVAAGIAVGLLLSAGVARLLAGMLYGIGPLDPTVFVLVPAGVFAVAVLASYIPARWAARVDPIRVLRAE